MQKKTKNAAANASSRKAVAPKVTRRIDAPRAAMNDLAWMVLFRRLYNSLPRPSGAASNLRAGASSWRWHNQTAHPGAHFSRFFTK
jgi:hypothetical protein